MFKSKKSIYLFLIAGFFISATTITSTLIINRNDDNYFEITKNIRIMASVYGNINTFMLMSPNQEI